MNLAIGLIAVLFIIGALVIWQHARRVGPREITFGIVNATSFVEARLEPDVRARLGPDGIRRIVEWEVFYLQGLAQENRRVPVETIAGDHEAAVVFIRGEIARSHNRNYTADDIASVLSLVAGYLESIGAIGDQAGGTAT